MAGDAVSASEEWKRFRPLKAEVHGQLDIDRWRFA